VEELALRPAAPAGQRLQQVRHYMVNYLTCVKMDCNRVVCRVLPLHRGRSQKLMYVAENYNI
jgi:hypothetical protein